MKHLYTLLFLIFSFSAQATEYLGGEITWKCLGNDSFEVTVTVYTHCGPNDTIDSTLTVTDSLSAYNVGLNLVSEEDITNVCDFIGTKCDSANAVFPYSTRKSIFRTVIDVGNYTGCNLRLSYSDCCRKPFSGTPSYTPDFYIESSFNRCLAPCGSSPEFAENPIGVLCAGQCVLYTFNATDMGGDSLRFAWTPSLSDTNASINYPSPYSYDKPIYFNGFPNNNLPPTPPLCRGFRLDSFTGDLFFRPMQQQRSQMAIKIDIYTNGIKTGDVTRDMHLNVISCPPNNVPVITGINGGNSFSTEACPGQTLSFNVNSDDQDSGDTLTMDWNGGIFGATFTVGTGRTPTGTFTWTPKVGDARPEPYSFTVEAKDDACPINTSTIRTFRITVKPLPTAEFEVVNNGCGSYTFKVDSTFPVNALVEWSGQGGIGQGNGGLDAESRQFTHRFLKGGTYPFQLKVISDCVTIYRDTLEVDSVPTVVLPADTILYRGDSMLLTPNTQFTQGPVQYLWLPDSLTSSSIYASPGSSDSIIVLATDTSGCTVTDTIYIEVWDVPSPSWINYNDSCGSLRFIVDSAHVHASSEFSWKFNDTITGNGAWLAATVPANGSYPLELLITSPLFNDTFQYRDTIVVSEIATVEISAPDTVCTSGPQLFRALPQGGSMPYNFTWSMSNSSYNADSVNYLIKDDTTLNIIFINAEGCTAHDTLNIITFPTTPIICQSSLDLCINSLNFNLNNVCDYNGEWQGPGVVDSMFYPSQAGIGNHIIQFTYTDIYQCVYRDSVSIAVKTLPAVTVTNLPPLCINSDSVSLFSRASPLNGTWSGTGVLAPFHFHPKIAGTGSHPLVYTYRGSNGCYNSDTIVANVNALPIVNAGSDFSICLNESRNMGGQPAGGTWNGPGIVGGNTLNGALAGVGNHPLIYHYTDSNGCASRDTVIAEVKTLPTVDAGANFSVCQSGASISLGGTPTGGTWRGIGVSNNEFDPSLAVTGTHPLIYEYELGCKNTDTLLVTVTAPVVDTGPDTELCLTDEPIAFFATPTGGTWSGTGIQNDSFYASIAGIGTFTINYSFTDTGQCAASNTMDVTVHPLPDFTPDYQVINPPTEVRFSLITGDTLSNYLWNFGDGSTSILASPVHNYPQGDTTYNAYITAQNQFQCIDTAYFEVVLDLTGIAEAAAQGFRIFPNPVSESLNIVVQDAWNNGRIQLLDLQGKVLYQQGQIKLARGETFSIEMQGLAAGTYLLQLVNAEGVHTVKIVK
ncbi:MAG: T9SS type A sorting domain-containing protein [Bacteroidia bacterium]